MGATTLHLPVGSIAPDPSSDLVQLMRSIGRHFGLRRGWAVEPEDKPAGLCDQLVLRHRHMVLLLVDGLGDGYLRRSPAGGSLLTHRVGALSSVFPSTTASAITSVMTGLAPIQHGLLGWFVRDSRFGGVLAPLPMTLRAGGEAKGLLRLRRLFPYQTLFQRLPCKSTVVSPLDIVDSPYNRRHSRGARRIGYRGLAGLVGAIREAVMSHGPAGGHVYAYYPRFDAMAHAFGVGSHRVAEEFDKVEAAIGQVARSLAGLGVDLLVTADHGFIDVPPEQTLDIAAWPEVGAMLAAPLWGERRAVWCAVRPGADGEFEDAMSRRLGDSGVVQPTSGVAESGMLGRGRACRRLAERMGTHAIWMAPGWALRDRVPGEVEHVMIGLHGGLSADEMKVPLIHFDCP